MQPNFPSRLFGTSGIRGPPDEFLSSGFAEKLGQTFAAQLGGRGTVSVARDVRLHSKRIQTALTDGLLKGGVDVVDCGLAPTPTLLFGVKRMKASAGVMVSGSHTPAEVAGILFFLGDTGEMDSDGEESFQLSFAAEPWLHSAQGRKGSLQSGEIIEPYLKELAREVGNIGGYRVVADPGNGATCATLAKALEAFGCSVATINGEPNGHFPSRPPNPQPSTLTQLSRAVKENKADFGVGTDSDGDRAIFATNEGDVLWGDLTSGLFARNEAETHVGGTIITTINTSSIVRLACRQHGTRLIITKVGPPAIAGALRSTRDAIFATEESGKHIWPDIILYGDAALASGKLLHIMKEQAMGLAQLVDTLPKFIQQKSVLDCPDRLKSKAMKLVVDMWNSDGEATASTLDGLKVEYPDLTWFLVRASGTEPLLRCSAEGKSLDEAQMLLARAERLAVKAITEAKGATQN